MYSEYTVARWLVLLPEIAQQLEEQLYVLSRGNMDIYSDRMTLKERCGAISSESLLFNLLISSQERTNHQTYCAQQPPPC